VLKGQGLVQMFYSLEDENRQRAGQPPIVVNVTRERLVAPVPPEPTKPSKKAEAEKSAKKPAAKKTTARQAPAAKKAKKKKR
jgi:hypothetical protein